MSDKIKIKALRLEPPYIDWEDRTRRKGEFYVLPYVSEEKTVVHAKITKELFRLIETKKMTYDLKSDFIMYKNDQGLITQVSTVPKPRDSWFEEVEDTSSSSGYGKVILQILPDSSVHVKHKPPGLRPGVIDEIIAGVDEMTEIKTEDFVADKYMVTDVRQNGRFIHVDPNER